MVNPRQRVSKRFFGWLSLLLLSVLVGIVPQATVSAAPLCSSVASSGTKPAPVGNISTWPKWRQIFIDNFDRCSLGGDWVLTMVHQVAIRRAGGIRRWFASTVASCSFVRNK